MKGHDRFAAGPGRRWSAKRIDEDVVRLAYPFSGQRIAKDKRGYELGRCRFQGMPAESNRDGRIRRRALLDDGCIQI